MRIVIIGMLALLHSVSCTAKQALIFSGGWKGHTPHKAAAYMQALLEEQGYTVTAATSMDCLDDAKALAKYDLIIPNWTKGKISEAQLENLSAAVKAGAGLAGLHGGMGSAFGNTPEYEAMVGGQFLKHPDVGSYTVEIRQAEHPIMKKVPGTFEYDSEKYFMRLADDIIVLADTDYSSVEPGLRMPVAWVKQWGKGRVFYSALGHDVLREYEKFPAARQIFINGCLWTSR